MRIPWLLKTPQLLYSPLFYPLCLGTIFLFIAFFRFYGLALSPPGYYIDESAMTINGYAILTTAKDEHGLFLPLFFQSFGDWKEPIFIYSQLPFLLIFKETILATRMTSAVWGLATVILFYFLLKERLHSKSAILIGTLIFGLLPWNFHFSRIGFQLITLPFFMTLYLYCLSKYEKTQRLSWYLWSIITLGLSFYTYYAGRFYSLFFFLLQFVILRHTLNLKRIALSIVVMALILLPAVFWNLHYPGTLLARYNTVTIAAKYHQPQTVVKAYLSGYLMHFSPEFLFQKGGNNLRHSPQYRYPLLWCLAPLLLLGLVYAISHIKNRFNQLLIIAFITFPVASAITTDPPHVHRTVQVIPFLVLLMVLGYEVLEKQIIKRLSRGNYYLALIFALVLLTEWGFFSKYYFTKYPQEATLWFHAPDITAIRALLAFPGPYYLSNQLTDYQMTTYELESKTDIHLIQDGDIQHHFFNPHIQTHFGSGYYLLSNQDCSIFFHFNPQAKLAKYSDGGFCIYKL